MYIFVSIFPPTAPQSIMLLMMHFPSLKILAGPFKNIFFLNLSLSKM